MRGQRRTGVKFGIFALIMALLTAGLFVTFSEHRSGSATTFSAVFVDASEITSGDSVRVAGIRVGTVRDVTLQPDKTVEVTFDVDRGVVLTTGTKVAVRYLNLVGDRYLSLVDGPGSTRILPAGSRIPSDLTVRALDLDVLLGGLKPVVQGLNPQDINALTGSLLRILQGQQGTLESIFTHTSSFTTVLADNGQVVEQLIANLRSLLTVLSKEGGKFSATIDRLDVLVGELSAERDLIGSAIDSVANGTASLAGLLADARAPLNGTVDELGRVAPLLEKDLPHLEAALKKAPGNYRKLVRIASYGSFIQFYMCGMTIRVSDLQGRTAVFPWFKQQTGRCAEE
ncbi:MCE family protein [Mycolicibacterium novocastrense]|uniref:MCE family protein n=1 Tax=Mycolicibacterium novocastrense TaxID=59813 RepID=UPI0009EBC022|nr:MCE family protein [Mycolicibacterium novocastrense]